MQTEMLKTSHHPDELRQLMRRLAQAGLGQTWHELTRRRPFGIAPALGDRWIVAREDELSLVDLELVPMLFGCALRVRADRTAPEARYIVGILKQALQAVGRGM